MSIQPQPQNPYDYQQGADSNNSKTILIIIGILLGVFLLCAVVCGGAVYYVASSAKSALKEKIAEEQVRAEQRRNQFPTSSNPLRKPSIPKPVISFEPKDLAEAARDLKVESKQFRALSWLKKQKFDTKHQKEIRDGLLVVLKSRNIFQHRDALNLLDTWGDDSIALTIASTLSERDYRPEKLKLLTKYKDPKTAPMIADLFGDSNEAEQALRAIGKESAPYLTKYLSDPNSRTKARASVLLEEFGVDVKEMELDSLVERLKNSDPKKPSRNLLEALMKMERDETKQPAIVKELNKMLPNTNVFTGRDIIKTLHIWGDTSSNPKVIQQMETSSSFQDESAKFLTAHADQSTVPILANELTQYRERGEAAVAALIGLGEMSISSTLPYFNSTNGEGKKNARKVIENFKGIEQQIVKQCCIDLANSEQRVGESASIWLNEADYIEEEQPAVAKALSEFLLNHRDNRYAQPAYIRWAGEKQAEELIGFLENRREEIWTAAYKRLIELEEFKLLYSVTYKMLAEGNRFRLSEFLRSDTVGNPEIEAMIIKIMGKHTDENALEETCNILGAIGGKDSISAIKKLKAAAQRERSLRVIAACSRATDNITERMNNPDLNIKQ